MLDRRAIGLSDQLYVTVFSNSQYFEVAVE